MTKHVWYHSYIFLNLIEKIYYMKRLYRNNINNVDYKALIYRKDIFMHFIELTLLCKGRYIVRK